MSTHGVVAVLTAEGGWCGRYHHQDSNPTGLGITLWALYHATFDCDIHAMHHALFDAHPGGWLDLNRAGPRPYTRDELAAASYLEPGDPRSGATAQCLCHGTGRRPDNVLVTCRCPADTSGCEPDTLRWAYVLTPRHLRVYSTSLDDTGRELHRHLADVPWETSSPGLADIERRGHSLGT